LKSLANQERETELVSTAALHAPVVSGMGIIVNDTIEAPRVLNKHRSHAILSPLSSKPKKDLEEKIRLKMMSI